MDAHLTDAVLLLNSNRRLAAAPKFEDLSEKELQRVENLIYFMRHAATDEVDDVVRQAARFRRTHEEQERKHTAEAKPARRARR